MRKIGITFVGGVGGSGVGVRISLSGTNFVTL